MYVYSHTLLLKMHQTCLHIVTQLTAASLGRCCLKQTLMMKKKKPEEEENQAHQLPRTENRNPSLSAGCWVSVLWVSRHF